MTHMVEGAFSFLQERFYIFPHSESLLADVSRMNDFTLIVDTCRSRNEHLTTVAIIHIRTAFEAHAIFIGRIQVSGRI